MKALIVDDERLARGALRRMLRDHADVTVIGEAATVDQAIERILELQPDVVFLDIEMPGENGLELCGRLAAVPAVVFTTAHHEHAVRAFELDAVDYLLKPVPAARLATALEKIRRGVRSGTSDREPNDRTILLELDGRARFVPLSEIRLLESRGNRTLVYLANERPIVPGSLRHFEGRLDPSRFVRVSRAHLINLAHTVALEPGDGASLTALLREDLQVPVSRRRAQRLRRLLRI